MLCCKPKVWDKCTWRLELSECKSQRRPVSMLQYVYSGWSKWPVVCSFSSSVSLAEYAQSFHKSYFWKWFRGLSFRTDQIINHLFSVSLCGDSRSVSSSCPPLCPPSLTMLAKTQGRALLRVTRPLLMPQIRQAPPFNITSEREHFIPLIFVTSVKNEWSQFLLYLCGRLLQEWFVSCLTHAHCRSSWFSPCPLFSLLYFF